MFQPDVFLIAAGSILTVTAAAKLIGLVFDPAPPKPDPLIGFVSQGALIFLVALIELAVAVVATSIRFKTDTKLLSVLVLSGCFGFYRLGLYKLGIRSCSCLGTLPTGTVATVILTAILAYLIAGCLYGLFTLFRSQRTQ